MPLANEIKRLLASFDHCSPSILDCNVIPWSSPIPVFGRIAESSLASLGINPSNREFIGQDGNELVGCKRRFQTLTSLKLNAWSDASVDDIQKIEERCTRYFDINPYDRWFKRLDYVMTSCGVSYYSNLFPSCHLDLVPFATWDKWGTLPIGSKRLLLESSTSTISRLVRDSQVRTLILNGQSVIRHFQKLVPDTLEKATMPEWELSRSRGGNVPGFAYRATVNQIGDIDLRREVLVLGYNHNLQSSFGVTKEVMRNIGRWLSQEIESK
jgi:hypothetical protein